MKKKGKELKDNLDLKTLIQKNNKQKIFKTQNFRKR